MIRTIFLSGILEKLRLGMFLFAAYLASSDGQEQLRNANAPHNPIQGVEPWLRWHQIPPFSTLRSTAKIERSGFWPVFFVSVNDVESSCCTIPYLFPYLFGMQIRSRFRL
jgi:hypothetical protein